MADLPISYTLAKEPSLALPNVKPIGRSRINWSHHLAKDLVGVFLVNEKTEDLTKKTPLSLTGTMTEGFDDQGRYTQNTVNGNAINMGSLTSNDPLKGSLSDDISLYTFVKFNGSKGNGRIIELSSNAGAGTSGYILFNTATELRARYNGSGGLEVIATGLTNGVYYGFGCTAKSGSTVRGFLDGAFFGTSVSTFLNIAAPTATGKILNYAGGANNFGYAGEVFCIYVWNRALTDIDQEMIHSDRYCFLEAE